MPAIKISRSITIDSPIEKVFESISNFREWPRWSPWLITEPDCEVTYADDGKSYSWKGQYIGSGQMMVEDSKPNEAINYNLQFIKPWKSTAKVNMQFSEEEKGTKLTWNMDSSLPFFMFFFKKMMEGMIGLDYERGLSMLKDLMETGDVPVNLEFGETKVEPITLVGKNSECAIGDMEESMTTDIAAIKKLIGTGTLAPSGKMLCIYL